MLKQRERVLLLTLALCVCAATILPACASRMLRDDSLILEVTPNPVERGKTGQVTVNAPMNAQEVIGKVRVTGSPEFIFAKDKKRAIWYFVGKIPFSPWIGPGMYRIRVIVKDPPSKDRYTETELELK